MSSICLPLCLWVVMLQSPQHMHSYREAVSPIRKGRMKGRRWQTLSPFCHFFNKKKAKFPFQRVYWCSIGWDTRSLALDPRRAASQASLQPQDISSLQRTFLYLSISLSVKGPFVTNSEVHTSVQAEYSTSCLSLVPWAPTLLKQSVGLLSNM